jgi:hypothetical protein
VIEAELQAVLNNPTENFHTAFKNMAEVLKMVHTCGRGLPGG